MVGIARVAEDYQQFCFTIRIDLEICRCLFSLPPGLSEAHANDPVRTDVQVDMLSEMTYRFRKLGNIECDQVIVAPVHAALGLVQHSLG